MMRFDVIVVGLGAVGSAAAYELAKGGRRVLGIDAWEPPHIYGSSHGETRITRAAIGEGPEFSPLAIRSLELWKDAERRSGAKLLVQCGCLSVRGQGMLHGVPHFFENIERAAQLYGVLCEMFSFRRRDISSISGFSGAAVRRSPIGFVGRICVPRTVHSDAAGARESAWRASSGEFQGGRFRACPRRRHQARSRDNHRSARGPAAVVDAHLLRNGPGACDSRCVGSGFNRRQRRVPSEGDSPGPALVRDPLQPGALWSRFFGFHLGRYREAGGPVGHLRIPVSRQPRSRRENSRGARQRSCRSR
jgi:hypothetical protein